MVNYDLVANSAVRVHFTFAAQPSGSLRHSCQRIPTEAGTANE